MYRVPAKLALMAVIAVGATFASGAHGISLVWTKTGTPGNWSDPANWNPPQTPQPVDNLAFTTAGSAVAINDLPADCQLANISISTGVIIMASPLLVGGTLFQAVGPSTLDFDNYPWTVRGTVQVSSIVDPGLLTKTGTGSLSTNGASLGGGLRISSGTTQVFEDLSVTTLTIDPGATLDAGARRITATSHVTLLMGATYSHSPGASLVLGGGRLLASGNSLRDVEVTGSVTALDPLIVDGNLMVTGSLKTNDALQVYGGTAVAGTGVLELGDVTSLGGNATVSPSATLRATGPTITFAAGSATQVAGTLHLTGPTLRSSSPGTQYTTTVSGTATTVLRGLDVQDSDASAGMTLSPEPSVDSGNNVNWDFGTIVASDPIPTLSRLALDAVRPNPSVRELTLLFSLADATPATVELFDVGGRRLLKQEVGSLGPGRHVFRLLPEQELASGVYLVRLTQGGRSLSMKAAVAR